MRRIEELGYHITLEPRPTIPVQAFFKVTSVAIYAAFRPSCADMIMMELHFNLLTNGILT